ncbi:M15 family metallopeptidase [Acinetobacter sp. WZC-1]|uniref:M15 family metallopeptidase n=1 Tax=Acinetobacter sp. WZC-1 TaxID=3459034 RepID=UPI00403E0FEA
MIKLINTAYQRLGITWVITDGYRSPSAQDALPRANTNAKALQSYHQYGLAIDIVSVRKGEITYLSDDNQSKLDSQKIGPIGQELGLEWGGSWKKKDWPHFQLSPNGKTWRELKPQLLELGVKNYKNLKF